MLMCLYLFTGIYWRIENTFIPFLFKKRKRHFFDFCKIIISDSAFE